MFYEGMISINYASETVNWEIMFYFFFFSEIRLHYQNSSFSDLSLLSHLFCLYLFIYFLRVNVQTPLWFVDSIYYSFVKKISEGKHLIISF